MRDAGQRPSGLPQEESSRERPGAAGVTEEHLPGPRIARFVRVAPGFFPTPLCVPGVVRGCAVEPMNPGALRVGCCDPGCDQAVIARLLAITLSGGILPAGSPASCLSRSSWSPCSCSISTRRPGLPRCGRFRGSSRLLNAPLWPGSAGRRVDGRRGSGVQVAAVWFMLSTCRVGAPRQAAVPGA